MDFMLKIDLAKAFDRIGWRFIVSALTQKGLHSHFINLVYACISLPTDEGMTNGPSTFAYLAFWSRRDAVKGISKPTKMIAWRGPRI
jgi:hypothetical protein